MLNSLSATQNFTFCFPLYSCKRLLGMKKWHKWPSTLHRNLSWHFSTIYVKTFVPALIQVNPHYASLYLNKLKHIDSRATFEISLEWKIKAFDVMIYNTKYVFPMGRGKHLLSLSSHLCMFAYIKCRAKNKKSHTFRCNLRRLFT